MGRNHKGEPAEKSTSATPPSKEQRLAEALARNKPAIDWAEALCLATPPGSPAQAAWAQTIRMEAVDYVLGVLKGLGVPTERVGAHVLAASELPNAAWWISVRHNLIPVLDLVLVMLLEMMGVVNMKKVWNSAEAG